MLFNKKLIKVTAGLSLLCLSLVYGITLRQRSPIFSKNDSYEKLWKQADSCENKGLTESAWKVVVEIYARAKTENNAAQFVKAVIYKQKLIRYKEEFSSEKNINALQDEVNTSFFPAKPVLQSLLAESYWRYYQANRWKFYERSQTLNFQKGDVSTYDLKSLLQEVIINYKASLSDTVLLQKTRIDVMEEVLVKGGPLMRTWRPTLYDFLAHRALDFYKSSEADVTKAASQFAMNEPAYMMPYPEFLKLGLVPPEDSLDLKFYSVRLFQDLLNFHLRDKNEDALLDVDLERLQLAMMFSKNEHKDSLYLQTLDWLAKRFEKNKRLAEILELKAQWWYTGAAQYHPLESEAFKWNKKQAFDICTQVVKGYPATRGAQLAKNTILQIQSPALSFHSEEINDVSLPNRVLINYTNISKVYFKLVKVNYLDYQKSPLDYYYQDKETITRLLAMPVVSTFSQELPDDKDYNPHAVEVKIPALDLGSYVLIASSSEQFRLSESNISYALYVVSDMAYLDKRKKGGGYEFYMVNRQNGKPIGNVSAQTWYSVYNSRSSKYEHQKGKAYVSDEKGRFEMETDGKGSSSFFMEFTNGKDKLITGTDFYNYKDYPSNTPDIRSFIFTDRAIYRPGQTVYFKSIVLKKTGNICDLLPGRAVTIYFYDVNHQKIASQELVTNDYGTVSGSFTAPQGVLTGQMEITDGYGSARISVEEYKRPKFETSFDTLKGSYHLNDSVDLKGIAKAYAGNVIDGAEVKYRVLRRVNYPYWWYWYRSSNGASEVEITHGSTKTDEKGTYTIRFKALSDPTVNKKESPIYTFEIHADVTDLNGEMHSTETDFRVGYAAIELSFSSPDLINVKDIPVLGISTVNLNGVEEPATGKLTVYQLQQPQKVFRKRLWEQPDKHIYSREEYDALFPNDLYEDETNQYKWSKLKVLFTVDFNTGKNKTIPPDEFKNLSPGVYRVEGNCHDKSGEEVKSVNYITVYNPASAELPLKLSQWTYDIKSSAEPGDKASFILASSYSDITCLYEVEGEKRKETGFISPSLKPIEVLARESDRGGLLATIHFVKFGRIYSSSHYITVPFTNKELLIDYATFRNKLLPGAKEEWKLTIRNKKGDKAAAEMVASLYDASLDAFRSNYWNFNIYNSFYPASAWTHSLEHEASPHQYSNYRSEYTEVDAVFYDQLNYFGMNYYGGLRGGRGGIMKKSYRMKEKDGASNYQEDRASEDEAQPMASMAAPSGILHEDPDAKSDSFKSGQTIVPGADKGPSEKRQQESVTPRKNFNETAFFFPQLQTNEKGEIIIQFTIPESLTKWKFMGFAHTKDLSYGYTQNEVVTQKELMVVPNPPRFFREGDKMTFVSKISNLSDKDLNGTADLKFYNVYTDEDISSRLLDQKDGTNSFTIKKGQSTSIEWKISLPEGVEAIKYKVVAQAGNFSDGEEMVVPVLTNRLLVTESLPLPVRGNQTKEFSFTKFISQNNNSPTLRNQAYTLEFTANPAWYAVQSLPYLMEYPYECAEQTFARYYSNALASHIVNSKPKIRLIFESWKLKSPESFLSNLEKNQELKALLLEETPWVLQSKNESENKKRVALLFDLNKMSSELNSAINKLSKMQADNGGWPWFSGCPEDVYITQHILTGFGHLQKLAVLTIEGDPRVKNMVTAALPFCDQKLYEEYSWLKRHNKEYQTENHLSSTAIQYLYMRSYFKEYTMSKDTKEAFSYYKKQAQTYWLSSSRYLQGMIALGLNRFDDSKTSGDILRSLRENALQSEEMGMYWKDNYPGYYWYQAPIETQALMIEAFDEIAKDTKVVDDLKTWLIKSKQTQSWGTTRATTEAVYALLLRGSDWLGTEPDVEISLGAIKLDPKMDPQLHAEAGTGYFKKTYTGTDIQPSLGKIKIVKKDAGVSWGAVYWQYFEQLDKITPHETPLMLTKKLFFEKATASGPVIVPITENSRLKPGDKVKIRMELKVDRDMEYVHLKDMRAAGFEPLNVLSGYHYQDGLGYYQSTRDASTNFFISYLPKGTYVFEYPVVVSHYGDFSNGISSIQCMYAPEFTSHSEGIRVKVGD